MPAFKNFGITFLISVLIFSIVAYFMVGFLTSTVSGILDKENDLLDSFFTEPVTDTTDPDKKDPDDIPEVKGESFTVLFALTDKRTDVYDYFPEKEKDIEKIETDAKKSFGLLTKDYHTVKVKSIVLVRICKETGEYSILPVPSISKVYTQMGAGYTLLEDVMYFYDKEYFVQKVSAMTGIIPDYTFITNISEMDDVVKAVGSFTCYVSEDIYTDGKTYFPEPPKETTSVETTVPETKAPEKDKNKADVTTKEEEKKPEIKKTVSAGKVTVGASNVEAILLYENYTEGVAECSELHAEFVKGMLSKLSKMDDSALAKLLAELVKKEKIQTDMTEAQLKNKGEIIRAFDKFTVKIYEYPGAMAGQLFAPDIMGAARQYLGLRIPADPEAAS